MSPTIKDGDKKIFLRRKAQNGDIVLAQHRNTEVVKRYKNGKLIGDNINPSHNIDADFVILGVLWPKR